MLADLCELAPLRHPAPQRRPGLRPGACKGGVQIARLSPQMVREWRATLLNGGVSVSVTAKAYRLLCAIMMIAVDEDKILPRNPCQIRKAGTEDAAERPVLTMTQVFALAEQVGRRPVGNIREIPGGYRLRFRRGGEMRTSPEVYATRAAAERTLWTMASDDRAECTQDRRFYALVLLATFSSLRWGEVTALRRRDLDLDARTVRIRAAYIERSTGEMLLGPPKSQAGRRIVGVPGVIVPALRAHHRRLRPGRARRAHLPRCQKVARSGGATSTRCRPGRTPSRPSACRGCTSTTSGTRGTSSRRTAAPGCGT
jgi:integrase